MRTPAPIARSTRVTRESATARILRLRVIRQFSCLIESEVPRRPKPAMSEACQLSLECLRMEHDLGAPACLLQPTVGFLIHFLSDQFLLDLGTVSLDGNR